jgi:plasmid stability protein
VAQILTRDPDDGTLRLEVRAQRHGRSLQDEVKLILAQAAGLNFREARALAHQWQQKPAGRPFPDSTDLVREDPQR